MSIEKIRPENVYRLGPIYDVLTTSALVPVELCRIPLPSQILRQSAKNQPIDQTEDEENEYIFDKSVNMMACNFVCIMVNFMQVPYDSSIAHPNLILTATKKIILKIYPDLLDEDADNHNALLDPDQEEKLLEFFTLLEECLPDGVHLDADRQIIIFDSKASFFNLLCTMILHEELDLPQPEDMHRGWPSEVKPEEIQGYFVARNEKILRDNIELEQDQDFILRCAPYMPYLSLKSYFTNAVLASFTPIDMSMDTIRDVLKSEGVDVYIPREFGGKSLLHFAVN